MDVTEYIMNMNVKEFNGLVGRIIKTETDMDADIGEFLLLFSVGNLIAMDNKRTKDIYLEHRGAFFEKCAALNREIFLSVLKIGKTLSERLHDGEGTGATPADSMHEIENIGSFLANSGNPEAGRATGRYFRRGVAHMFARIDDKTLDGFIKDAFPPSFYRHRPINDLRNELLDAAYSISLNSDPAETAKYLCYFNDSIPYGDYAYACLHKAFFQALRDYSACLRESIARDNLENKAEKQEFSAFEEDFREGYKGLLSYGDIKEAEKFQHMEKCLFEDGIIDAGCNFVEKRGNKKNLAAVYKFMIKEGYFRKSNYRRQGNFKEFHYRQYLDHRYNVDTAQQFKNTADGEVRLFILSKAYRYGLGKIVVADYFSVVTP